MKHLIHTILLVLFSSLVCTELYPQSEKNKFEIDLAISFDSTCTLSPGEQGELRKLLINIFDEENMHVVHSIDYCRYKEFYFTFKLLVEKSTAKISIYSTVGSSYSASYKYPKETFNYAKMDDIVQNVRNYIHKYIKKES